MYFVLTKRTLETRMDTAYLESLTWRRLQTTFWANNILVVLRGALQFAFPGFVMISVLNCLVFQRFQIKPIALKMASCKLFFNLKKTWVYASLLYSHISPTSHVETWHQVVRTGERKENSFSHSKVQGSPIQSMLGGTNWPPQAGCCFVTWSYWSRT